MATLRRRIAPGLAALTIGLGATSVARADLPEPAPKPKKHQMHWDPAWSHAGPWDYSLTAVALTAVTVEVTVFQNINPPMRWRDPILFDNDAREALRSPNADTRSALDYTASVLWGIQLCYPVLVDVPFAWIHYGKQVAWDLFWQDAVTMILAGAVDAAVRDVVGRARPYIYDCLQQGGAHCLDSPEATRSFPGGHFSNSTAASVLTCTQHLYMRLYGGPWDAFTCGLTLTSNALIGVMRIVSDNHWASDELIGGALGALIGWGVPYAMHFHGHTPTGAEHPKTMVLPVPTTYAQGGGLGLVGIF